MSKFLVVALLISGCSVTFQSKPKHASSSCSTTHAWWVADSVGVAAGVAAIAAGIAMGGGDKGNAVSGAGVLGSIGYLASAHNGYKWRRSCAANEQPAAIAVR